MTACAVFALVIVQAASPSPAPTAAPSPSPSTASPAAASPAPASPAPVPVTPPPAPEVLYELLKKAPAFTADPTRTGLRATATTPMRVPGVDDKGYFIEFQWTDKAQAAHTGVAVVAHKSVAEVPWMGKGEGDWGLVQVFEDKPMGILMDELKRTRIAANEAVAVADIRNFMTGQTLFMSLADGAYGEFRCMRRPSDCIVGVPEEQMMEPGMLVAERRGYRRKFHPGARVTGPKAKGSPSPFLKSFAYTAVPIAPGESGVRGFCGDPSGRICVTADGSEPAVVGGACASPCTELK
jgi:hypothetical protein